MGKLAKTHSTKKRGRAPAEHLKHAEARHTADSEPTRQPPSPRPSRHK